MEDEWRASRNYSARHVLYGERRLPADSNLTLHNAANCPPTLAAIILFTRLIYRGNIKFYFYLTYFAKKENGVSHAT